MGWFGSLGLATKYAMIFGALLALVVVLAVCKIIYSRHKLKKCAKQEELEAQGVQEERVELNARELDEGDLFGIRAIQSGYFGGVAQSRPVSPVRGHSSDGSTTNTLLGSRPSPKVMATTPMSSVSTLPLDARQTQTPSPLSQTSLREGSRPVASPRRNLTGSGSRLQPSEAELNGRINHDPAVNMSLELPPSPLRPTAAAPTSPGSRSPSPSYPFPVSHDHHHRASPTLRPGRVQELKGYKQPLPVAEMYGADIRSQSGSIVSRSTTDDARHDGGRSPTQEYRSPYEEYPVRPVQSAPAHERLSDELFYPSAPSHVPRGAPLAAPRPMASDEVPHPPTTRVEPTASDWENEMYHDMNQSLHGPTTHGPGSVPAHGHQPSHRADQPHGYYPLPGESSNTRYTHHASSLSDSSSIYSSANAGQRHMSRPLSPELKSPSTTPTSTVPSSAGSDGDSGHEPSGIGGDGARPGSDASFHHPTMSSDTTDSGSHRHTRELGDFYDSYWRQSTQGSTTTGRGSDAGPHRQSGYFTSKGLVEGGKDGKRPGPIDSKVATIEEVDTPLASPMPGTAL